jgi:hypothetical protein
MAEKVARKEVTEAMVEILASHVASNIHFLFTRDESLLLYSCHIQTMWALYPENVDPVQNLSYVDKKTMTARFFNGTRLHRIDIRPQNQKMDAEYFAEHRAYYAIISFDLLSNKKELPTEKMRCPF